MRQKLNENPVAQIAVIAVLALVVGIFLLHPFGGGGESEATAETSEVSGEAAISTEVSSTGSEEAAGIVSTEQTATTTSTPLPVGSKMPGPVKAAYRRGDTIVLLVYRPGGIDDKLTRESTEVVGGMSAVAFFETSVDHIARYAEITGPLGVEQAPALVVVRSKRLNGGGPAPSTVTYGFQTADDVRQAIVDSRYRGPELTYAPN
jgi:hypothetical protein